jgi:hypothetical protein
MDNYHADKGVRAVNKELVGVFLYIEGFTDGTEDMPDGAYLAMKEEATESYNKDFGTELDWFDIMQEYITWSNARQEQDND